MNRTVLLPVVIAAVLAACGGATESNPEDTAGTATGGGENAGSSMGGRGDEAGSGGVGQGGSLAGSGGASHGGSGGASHGGHGGAGHAGSGGSSTGGSGGTGGGATMAEVQAIFTAHCINCHDKSKVGLPTFGALSLLPGDAHDALVNKRATEACGGIYVVPGDPAHSYLMHKVTEAMPCEGQQMPRPFEIIKPPPLTAKEIATIRSWITAGAPR
jgi:hypothetical protein